MMLIFGVSEVNIKALLAEQNVAGQTLILGIAYSFY
jgi:hypothetical protein